MSEKSFDVFSEAKMILAYPLSKNSRLNLPIDAALSAVEKYFKTKIFSPKHAA